MSKQTLVWQGMIKPAFTFVGGVATVAGLIVGGLTMFDVSNQSTIPKVPAIVGPRPTKRLRSALAALLLS